MTGLARCVGDAARFLGRHWSWSPFYLPQADGEAFSDLFSLDEVDRAVSTSFLRLPTFRMVRDGKPLDRSRYTKSSRLGGTTVSGVGNPGAIYREFAAGATIVFQGLHRSWEPLTRFCRQLELELTHPVQANAYITPPVSRGLGVHYDTHDVFVLQLAGHKEWLVYDPVVEDPLPSQPWSSGMAAPEEPCLEADLGPGDCLYVPRGFLHSARAREGVSAHLTIGVLTSTWHDAMGQVVAALADEVEFRRSLAPGFAYDEERLASDLAERVTMFRDWLEKADLKAVAAKLARRFWSNRPPVLTGQLQQVLALDRIGDATTVRRREGAVCRLRTSERSLSVLLGDRELVMPAPLEPAMARVTTGEPLAVGELGDLLDQSSRLVLVRRLVREGLLEVVALG
ncbi:MAG: cupin domain-containing protein [Actinomycetota bacterium]|nr:cupin domain-containing protein [Actinomycetota bacterium]